MLDAAGGLLIAVVGAVGVASVLASPAYLGTAAGPSRCGRTSCCFRVLGAAARGAAGREPRHRVAAGRGDDRAVGAARRLQRQGARARGGLEVPDPHLARARRRAARDRVPRGRHPGRARRASWAELGTYASGSETALVAYLLLLAGLAAKIGWAPVHNWLPDAHSEAPAPVSALLSAALLPSVLLVAWRSEQALAPVIGGRTAQEALIAFGLVSLAVAIPFLWRALAWKRLLAYSSLEHMGVIALGIGFASPLALAGVAVHIVGHAIAKALGFYAATPLIGHEPRAAGHAATGIARTQPKLAASLGISLGTLAGLPPSPLFASEVLIVAGGFQAGLRLGGRSRDRPARARLPRPRARAARDDGREGPPPRDRRRSRACAA